MFDNFKQLGKLKQMQEILEKEKGEAEIKGVRVVIDGKMEIQEIKLNPDLSLSEQEEILKECFKEAVKKVQQEAAGKMFQS